MLIKTGFLVAYDYEYLKNSMPFIYKESDVIVLAIDINRKTWAGNKFVIDDNFFIWLKEFDHDQKIKIYEDDFYQPNLSLKEMDTRQRQMLADYLGHSGWHIQLDVDEYFLEFDRFVRFLNTIKKRSTSVIVKFKTIIKETNSGYFLIKNETSKVIVATNNPVIKFIRFTKNKHYIKTNFIVLHQSYGKTEEQIRMKINNWGHKDDFDTNSFIEFWKTINEYNYSYFRDVHPLNPPAWSSIEFVNTKNYLEIKKWLDSNTPTFKTKLKKILAQVTPPILIRILRNLKWRIKKYKKRIAYKSYLP